MYEFEPAYGGHLPDEPVTSEAEEEIKKLKKEIQKLEKEAESLRVRLGEKNKKETRLRDKLRKLEEENKALLNLIDGDSVSGCKNCMRLEREIESLKESLIMVETERYIEFLQERVSTQGDSFSYLRENIWGMLEDLREGKSRLESEIGSMTRRLKLYKSLLVVSSAGLVMLFAVVLYLLQGGGR